MSSTDEPIKTNCTSPSSVERWLTKNRIKISLLTFAALIAVNLGLLHTRPQNMTDWTHLGTIAGCGLIGVGLAIRSWAAGTLHKSQKLTCQGPYSLVRNPLYVGSFLMMFGFCILLRDVASMLFVCGPILGIYWLTVRHEETNLSKWFPEDWDDYARTVPRFVPRVYASGACTGWSWRQWVKNREYQAVVASLMGLLAIATWSHFWYRA